jgi:hypothetical protein
VPPDAQPWPNRLADVIPTPDGEHAVLIALVQWARLIADGHTVLTLIGGLGRFWEPFAEILFQALGVAELATLQMQRALGAYKPGVPPTEQMTTFLGPVVACAQSYFLTLYQIDMQRTMELIAPVYEQLYYLCAGLEPIMLQNRTEMNGARRWFDIVRQFRKNIAPDGAFVEREPGPLWHGDARTRYAAAFNCMIQSRNRSLVGGFRLP